MFINYIFNLSSSIFININYVFLNHFNNQKLVFNILHIVCVYNEKDFSSKYVPPYLFIKKEALTVLKKAAVTPKMTHCSPNRF